MLLNHTTTVVVIGGWQKAWFSAERLLEGFQPFQPEDPQKAARCRGKDKQSGNKGKIMSRLQYKMTYMTLISQAIAWCYCIIGEQVIKYFTRGSNPVV